MTWFEEKLGLYEWLELERGQLSAIFHKIIIIVRICLFIHHNMIISILDLSSYLLEMLLIPHVHYLVKSTANILVAIGK